LSHRTGALSRQACTAEPRLLLRASQQLIAKVEQSSCTRVKEARAQLKARIAVAIRGRGCQSAGALDLRPTSDRKRWIDRRVLCWIHCAKSARGRYALEADEELAGDTHMRERHFIVRKASTVRCA
jgi:hypothetical protein